MTSYRPGKTENKQERKICRWTQGRAAHREPALPLRRQAAAHELR